MTLWQVIVYLAIGALIGWAASKVMKSGGGLIRNIIVGVAGSFLGGWIADLIGWQRPSLTNISLSGMLIAIGGACLLIWLARLITGRR